MTVPALERRAFLASLGAGVLGLAGLKAAAGREGPGPLFVNCLKRGEESYAAAGLSLDGSSRFELPLPARGHSTAFKPGMAECVVFARRPGTFAVAIDLDEGVALHRIESVPGRHFYGHGAYSPDGSLLYASENDFENASGVVGVYDAADGYRRLAEFPSFGVGPHDLRLTPDGRALLCANGGIATHPDFDRIKLNLPDMRPNLALIEPGSGKLLDERSLAPELHRLSTRHLAFGAGGVAAVAMQDEATGPSVRPLVALAKPGAEGAGVELLRAPLELLARCLRYTGSAAFDATGRFLAVSAPRGGLVLFWDVQAEGGPAFSHHLDLDDGCGVGPDGTPGGFLLTSGTGAVLRHAVRPDGAVATERVALAPGVAWDNHLTTAG